MNFHDVLFFLLLACCVFMSLAALGETIATRQIARTAYRWVPLVRAMRVLVWPATACLAGVVAFAAAARPASLSLVGLAVGFACLFEFKYLFERYNWRRLFVKSFIPAVAIGVTVFHLDVLDALPKNSMQLPSISVLVLVVLVGAAACITMQRDEQGLLALRD